MIEQRNTARRGPRDDALFLSSSATDRDHVVQLLRDAGITVRLVGRIDAEEAARRQVSSA